MKTTEFEYLIGANPEIARIELESQGLYLRVVMVDGEHRMVTEDIQARRINVSVADGVIDVIVGIG